MANTMVIWSGAKKRSKAEPSADQSFRVWQANATFLSNFGPKSSPSNPIAPNLVSKDAAFYDGQIFVLQPWVSEQPKWAKISNYDVWASDVRVSVRPKTICSAEFNDFFQMFKLKYFGK